MMIYLGSDHAGYGLKKELLKFLREAGHDAQDLGAHEYEAGDDYPDYIYAVAKKVAEDPANRRGIVVGGSGQGEAITANRVPGIRAAVFYGPMLPAESVDVSGAKSVDIYEIVKLSRAHNDANVLSLGARFLSDATAKKAVALWLETPFSGDDRHVRRIKKIDSA